MASKLQTRTLKYLKTLKPDCWAIKVMSANERGVPDILCCYKGRFIGIEIKEPKERVAGNQHEQHIRIAAAGGVAIVARDLETVKMMMEGL